MTADPGNTAPAARSQTEPTTVRTTETEPTGTVQQPSTAGHGFLHAR
jgi:hypothetical protein